VGSKGAFFSESDIRFSNLQISKKKLFQKYVLSLKFENLAHSSNMLWVGISNFKAQDSFLQ
jgi:hypothetical protein